MKRILTIAVLAITAMVCANSAGAQTQHRPRIIIRPQTPNPPGPRGRYVDVDYPSPEKRAANLAELLGLNDEQKNKVQAIFVEQEKQALAIWSDEKMATDVREKKLAEARQAASKQVRDVLTDDQKKKYDALVPSDKPAEKIRLEPDPKG
jgi:hypothetical protein